MMKILKSLQGIFAKKVIPTTFTTEPVLGDVDEVQKLIDDIRATQAVKGGISHEQLNAACLLCFGVELAGKHYRLKDNTRYGQYFTISKIKLLWNEDNTKLMDVIVSFIDESSCTSARFSVSISDLYEWLEPVTLSAPKPKQNMV